MHDNCGSIMKVLKQTQASEYELLSTGEHKIEESDPENRDAEATRRRPRDEDDDGNPRPKKRRQHGISLAIKSESDSLLLLGLTAGRVRNMLLFKCVDDIAMLLMIATTKQLENRKSYMKTHYNGGWEFHTFIALMVWCSSRMCQSHSTFWSGDHSQLSTSSELPVLDTFEHGTTVLGEKVVSLGMISTSRAVSATSFVLLKTRAARCVDYTRGAYVQRFRPWVYMFVRTESAYAYERMFSAIVKYTRKFSDIPIAVKSASIDHAECIAEAIETTWARCEVLTSWPHLSRQAGRKAVLLKHPTFLPRRSNPASASSSHHRVRFLRL